MITSTWGLNMSDRREHMNKINTTSGNNNMINSPFHNIHIVFPDRDKNIDPFDMFGPAFLLFNLHNFGRHDSPPRVPRGFVSDDIR
ncbi:hypothetical protein HanIR_Chr05g0246361 [Helianthus annuus]|nr:hypothetical protein HanIR_Chr05g0246361 [Helianthus annuus]